MVLLASQELAARAATHDRHLRHGAQLAVAKTTYSNLTDGARPAVKNRRQAVFENTLPAQTGWLRDDRLLISGLNSYSYIPYRY